MGWLMDCQTGGKSRRVRVMGREFSRARWRMVFPWDLGMSFRFLGSSCSMQRWMRGFQALMSAPGVEVAHNSSSAVRPTSSSACRLDGKSARWLLARRYSTVSKWASRAASCKLPSSTLAPAARRASTAALWPFLLA